MNFDIINRECPDCAGLGVRCTGLMCTRCGGQGAAGIPGATIGSGKIMIDPVTGEEITAADMLMQTFAGFDNSFDAGDGPEVEL